MVEKVIIMGAAGRDFHNFNVCFRDDSRYRVVAFTASQIPDIEGRFYPPQLAGKRYPKGIPIHAENRLAALIRDHHADRVVFSYSDISHVELMHRAAVVTAAGADFVMLGARRTMIVSVRPVIAVCAVRTGCGKSPTTRRICDIVAGWGKKAVVVRHPMPYGELGRQELQRFSSYQDFERHRCTIEEREEYESLVERGITVYAGIDYGKILRAAEKEADLIVWDGGNNDTPFLRPDIHVVLFDPHRAGHERLYYPGETNMLMADIAVIGKVDTVRPEQVAQVRKNIETHAPQAEIVLAESTVIVERPERIRGKRVLVVEDGPTLTHGGMPHGAGMIAARRHAAAAVVDPRSCAAGTLREVYSRYPHIGCVLPAMGYSAAQVRDLELTINRAACDLVLFATPVRLNRLLTINKPALRVRYEYHDHGRPALEEALLSRRHRLMR